MKNFLFIQENELSGATLMYPSTMQPLYTHVNKLVTSNLISKYVSQLHILVYMQNQARRKQLQIGVGGGGGGGGVGHT